MQFIERLLKIPAHAIVQGQLARDLPRILKVQTPRSPAIKQRLSVAGGNAVILADEETGPGTADAGSSGQHLPVKRLRGFRTAEAVRRGQVGLRSGIGGFVLPLG